MNGLNLSIRKPSYPKKWFSVNDEFSIDLKDYTIIRQLGTGSFGSVNLVSYNGRIYAMKNISHAGSVMDIIKNETSTFIFLNGIKELGVIIPELYFIFQSSESHVHIIMEAVNGEELYNIINSHIMNEKILTTFEILSLLIRISYRLKLLHDYGIIHYDLKPENIMINDTMIKFIDFGSSCATEISSDFCYSHFKGTDGYVSPEMFHLKKNKEEDIKIGIGNDIWGLGVIIYLLFEQKTVPLDETSIPNIENIKYDRINSILSEELNPYLRESEAVADTKYIFNHTDIRVYELIKDTLINNVFVDNELRITSIDLFNKLSYILNEYGYEYDITNDEIIKFEIAVKEGGYNKYLQTYLQLKKIQ